ncbi:WD repeat-containing protein 49-like [Sigmodon hispidus]
MTRVTFDPVLKKQKVNDKVCSDHQADEDNDIPRDFHHFWRPQPRWRDDLNKKAQGKSHGHKEDILCVAQCPPFLLATSSYDGEIIVWNVISGHVYCKLNSPSPVDSQDHREGRDWARNDKSVSRLTFLKTRATKLDSAAASLISNGPGGSVTFWKLFSGAGLVANFTPSRGKAQVSSIVVTAGDTLTYLADQQGFVHVYDIQEYGLQGPELQAPNKLDLMILFSCLLFHTPDPGLELTEGDTILLSSSMDCTVRLWSRDGAYIGTFGQTQPWDVFTPASWSHPRVPFEILTDPQSMPTHLVLEADVPAGCSGGLQEQGSVMEEKVLSETEKTPNLPPLEGLLTEAEMTEDKSQWSAFRHGRLLPARRNPRWKAPELKWPSIYQALQCHEVACVSALGEKPDLSIIDSEMLPINFHSQEREEVLLGRKSHPGVVSPEC